MEQKYLITKHYEECLSSYPKLIKLVKEGDFWRIDGCIDVTDDEGGYWETYEVSIFIPPDYPKDIPILQETGKKIKRESDWHMSSNGECCLATRAKIFHDLSEGITLLKWLDKFAHPFLANHVYRIKHNHYAHEEFSHGTKGIIEGWKKITGVRDAVSILKHLVQITGYRTQALNRPCFCGSGKKYKRCYEISPIEHRYGIPSIEILEDIKAISKSLGQRN
ncbi:MAG: SEC-C domain-containing protein [Chitinophagaceae bacterium]|nr:SEC-C domain-containing protein [Chitinophagaceae bacterium]